MILFGLKTCVYKSKHDVLCFDVDVKSCWFGLGAGPTIDLLVNCADCAVATSKRAQFRNRQ